MVAAGSEPGRRAELPPAADAELLSTSGMSPPARRLAAAALDLFYRQGALATSVRDITNACGLTPGALYNHFGSKNELLYVIVRDIHLRLEAVVERVRASAPDDPRAELAAIVRHYILSHALNRRSVRVANREYVLLTGEWLDEVVTIRRRLREQVAEVLWRGQQQGVFALIGPGRRAATITALAVLDMCVHISEWFDDGRTLTTEQLAERYVVLALRVAGAAPADTPPAVPPGRPAAPPPTPTRPPTPAPAPPPAQASSPAQAPPPAQASPPAAGELAGPDRTGQTAEAADTSG